MADLDDLVTFIKIEITTLSASDTDVMIIELCNQVYQKAIPTFTHLKPMSDEIVLICIDESTVDDGIDKDTFALVFAKLILYGLSKEQKIARFVKVLDEQRFTCLCDGVNWEVIKEAAYTLVEDVTQNSS